MKAVIFDLDGTLQTLEVDFQALREQLNELFSSYGVPPLVGSLLEAVERSLSRLEDKGLSPAQVKRLKVKANSLMDMAELDSYKKVRTFPHVLPSLRALRDGGYRLGVISRACRRYVDVSLERIGFDFDAVLSRQDVLRPKPDPEGILLLLLKMESTPAEAVVVGDHPYDIVAGKKAGTRVAGVLTGSGTRPGLVDAGAVAIFHAVGKELVDWIDGDGG